MDEKKLKSWRLKIGKERSGKEEKTGERGKNRAADKKMKAAGRKK